MDELKYFNKHQKKLISFLSRIRIGMSSLAISKRLKMHWTTVEDNLYDLESRDWVIREELPNKTIWQFNFEKYKELRKNKG